jgi:GntR family transcriptional regulator, trehalose operon transcriptional repressor
MEVDMEKRYKEIYQSIKNDIFQRKYKVGEKLPSENEFCKLYNASRGTIHKVLNLLAEEGLVNSMHGKGVFVLESSSIDFSFGKLVSFKEASESSGKQFVTRVEKFETITIDKTLQEKTGLPEGKEVYKIYRIRSLDGDSLIFDINYFLKDLITDLPPEIAEGSIYQYIEEQLNLKIGFAKRIIMTEPATASDKRYLDMSGFNFVIVVKNLVFLTDGMQFEYTESHHIPDRFVFTDFARRWL